MPRLQGPLVSTAEAQEQLQLQQYHSSMTTLLGTLSGHLSGQNKEQADDDLGGRSIPIVATIICGAVVAGAAVVTIVAGGVGLLDT